MIYYKIINTECDIYKFLKDQLQKEEEANVFNNKLIEDNIPYTFYKYRGTQRHGAYRVKYIMGFFFHDPEQVDLKAWKEDKNCIGLFTPNLKTKAGKHFANILKQQKGFRVYDIWTKLGLDYIGSYSCPYIEIKDGVILLGLDDAHRLKNEDLIEITLSEVESYIDKP